MAKFKYRRKNSEWRSFMGLNYSKLSSINQIKCFGFSWLMKKLKRDGSDYKLTKQDLDDIETAYEFQTSDLN